MKNPFIFLIFCLFGQAVVAQLNPNPPSVEWQQINSEHFNIIFPKGLEKEANRTTNTLEWQYTPLSKSLGKEPRKISIILQNQTNISNGFVTIFPRKSEFFTTPPQDPALLGNLNWLDQLATHEFRHVVQYDKALTGFSKAAYYLLGANGLAPFTAGVPNWLWEGDAVCAETVFSNSGRGRIPQFDVLFRSQLLSNGPYTYNKAALGSFKDPVDNHYVLGYYLSTYLKNKNGANVWNKILTDYYRFGAYPFAFSHKLKKNTGLKVESLYQETIADLSNKLKEQLATLKESQVQTLPTAQNKVYTAYEYPQALPSGSIIALKSGLGDIQQLVKLDGTREEKIFVVGLLNDANMLSVGNGKVVWAEFRPDLRFSAKNSSVIKVYDLQSKKATQLTAQTRLTAPSISPDGSKIAALETTLDSHYQINILDANSGQVLKVLENPNNDFFIQPRWSSDNKTLVVVSLNKQGKTLLLIDTDTEKQEELIPRSEQNLSSPTFAKGYILYNSPKSGIDNIHALNIQSKERFQVTSRKFGAYNSTLSADEKSLVFQDFTANGNRIVTMPFDPAIWQKEADTHDKPIRYFGDLVLKEAAKQVMEGSPEKNYEVKKYGKAKNLFNIYTWGPVTNANLDGINLGITSENLLSTTEVSAGYAFDPVEITGKWYAKASYQGMYPFLDVSVEDAQRKTSLYIDRAIPLDSLRKDQWRQQSVATTLRFPITFTHTKFYERAQFSVGSQYTKVTGYELPRGYFNEGGNGNIVSLNYLFTYSAILKQAKRDVQPRLGGSMYISYRDAPFLNQLHGSQWTLGALLYLPGVGKHHGVRLRAGYQRDGQTSYRFNNMVYFPRGQSYRYMENYYTAMFDYKLPLFYPDRSLTKALYFQRIKANIFTDYALGQTAIQGRTNSYQPISFGIDLTADFNLMRYAGAKFDVGIRTIYLQNEGRWFVQPLVIEVGL